MLDILPSSGCRAVCRGSAVAVRGSAVSSAVTWSNTDLLYQRLQGFSVVAQFEFDPCRTCEPLVCAAALYLFCIRARLQPCRPRRLEIVGFSPRQTTADPQSCQVQSHRG